MTMKQIIDRMLPQTIKDLLPAYAVLVFYLVVMMVTGTLGYKLSKDKKNGFSYGIAVGAILSVYLWITYGQAYVK